MTIQLSAAQRTILGKKVRTLRKQGQVPAVVYGHGAPTIALVVDSRELSRVYREAGESSLVELSVDGLSPKNVLIHDVSRDPLTSEFVHIDFYEVKMDEKLTAKVSLTFVGEAPATKGLGGTLVKNIHEVEVEALPKDLPHNLTVDVSKLATFEDRIIVQDVVLPPGVKVLADANEIVALVAPPRIEEEVVPPPTETLAEQVEQVKVEGEEKRKERETEREEEKES
ncbi:50S ribosomal protein L25 [Candidatus Parcubacteria bacterium]|nr:50S ribosomal protein L25 [Candidatus Parcubacteria bacterium]